MRGPWSLRTFAVAAIVIVTGSGPQLNVMIPPAATALTSAFDVQLAGEPVPMTWFGCEVSTARASAGMLAWPLAFPQVAGGAGGLAGLVFGEALGLAADEPGAGLEPFGAAPGAAGLPLQAETSAIPARAVSHRQRTRSMLRTPPLTLRQMER